MADSPVNDLPQKGIAAATDAFYAADNDATPTDARILGSGVNVNLVQVDAEDTASVTPTDSRYEAVNVKRYGAVGDGVTDDSAAFQAAIDVAIQGNYAVVIPDGSYRWDSQVVVEHPTTGTRALLDWQQSRSAVINSYVTGSVDGFDTAGFALVIDGMTDSNWYGLSINFDNGTAGVVMRCRNENCYRNNFYGAKIIGGATADSRTTRTKVNWRITGNESVANSTGYTAYFNQFQGPHFTIGYTLFDLVVGDGATSTQQPNAPMLIGPRFENYIVAVSAPDVDEIEIDGAFWQLAAGIDSSVTSITQTAGTATVTQTAHGYETDEIITIAGANESEYNGVKRITVTGANTYTFTVDSGTSSPATGTLTATLNTVGVKGETAFSRFSGIIDATTGALPYYFFSGSTASQSYILENTAVGGVVEDEGDNIFRFNNGRINGFRRINDRSHETDGDADLNIFGTGTFAQSGDGSSKIILWGRQGSTRNVQFYIRDTVAVLRAMVDGTTLELGADGETLLTLDKTATAGDTGMLLYDTDTDTIVRVSADVNDSGGTGFRGLRIPNT